MGLLIGRLFLISLGPSLALITIILRGIVDSGLGGLHQYIMNLNELFGHRKYENKSAKT